jgi:NAD+ dependent glucose-6-phosphate dehydrogenase
LAKSAPPGKANGVERKRILITGPGGRVGRHLLPLLRARFALRLFDLEPVERMEDDEFVQGDIRDLEGVKQACNGVSAVIHLAAVSDEDDFRTKLLPFNVDGTYSVFEAARLAGVPKVVFASTGQTILHNGKGTWITPAMPARPWTIYACTKLFGEALARYYADHHGMSMICIRLGWFQAADSPTLLSGFGHPREWCSPRDLAQLVVKSIESEVRFGIFFGVSNNTGRYWDLSNARQLIGYDPEDDAEQVMAAARSNL